MLEDHILMKITIDWARLIQLLINWAKAICVTSCNRFAGVRSVADERVTLCHRYCPEGQLAASPAMRGICRHVVVVVKALPEELRILRSSRLKFSSKILYGADLDDFSQPSAFGALKKKVVEAATNLPGDLKLFPRSWRQVSNPKKLHT